MIMRPLSQCAQDAIALPFIIATAPVWAPLVALIWVSVKLEDARHKLWRIIDPPGWRPVFAFWPAECDPWPGEGYRGWVWLETVWRNPDAPGWAKNRREPQAKDSTEGTHDGSSPKNTEPS